MKVLAGLLVVMLFLFVTQGEAQRVINYQGVLNDNNGNPVNDPTGNSTVMTFRLYTVEIDGTPLWNQGPDNVSVKKGMFKVGLTNLESLEFDVPYYLEIIINGVTLTPREAFGKTPYSIRAEKADHATNSDRSTNSDKADRADRADRSDHSDRSDRSDRADIADAIADNTVTSIKIVDGSIEFIDIGQNGATSGQVIKWNGSAWVAGDDNAGAGFSVTSVGTGTGLTGGPITSTGTISIATGGVTTDLIADETIGNGDIATDAIGTTNIQNISVTDAKINDVAWNKITGVPGSFPPSGAAGGDLSGTYPNPTLAVSYLPISGGTITGAITNTGDPPITMGKGNFGSNNTNTGTSAFVAGSYNTAQGDFSVVSGGGGTGSVEGNIATGHYSSIGGGTNNKTYAQHSSISGGESNLADGDRATVGGGIGNSSTGSAATVSGGSHNSARGDYSTVSGGGGPDEADSNSATGNYSMVAGGEANVALGDYSFTAGRRAIADHRGAFVWADAANISNTEDFNSEDDNTFNVRARGGVYIYTVGSLTAGVTLSTGSSSWSSVSDSAMKRNIRLVDGETILEKISRLPIKQWSYKAQDPSIEHIGPMAQDFYELFGVGENNKTISTIDPSGIALAAIQQVKKENDLLKEEVSKLREALVVISNSIRELQDASKREGNTSLGGLK